MTNPEPESRTRWHDLAHRFEEQASQDGMVGILNVFRDSLRPLSPLLAQMLWVIQPTMNLFGEGDSMASLAMLLDPYEATESNLSKETPPKEGG